ncbi:hypothetical protein ABW20_dc0103120 [Dactylellina cionopaga]|nr:hypothetical protein ABW20_dc0103120 [Dactylellina cionopaga]
MADSIFFSGRIEEAIAATVANQKPLVCFVTDESDDSNVWEQEYLHDETISTPLKDSAITVRLLKESTEANYLNAFCAITTYPTLLIIKNGGAGVDGLTVVSNPISKEDFVSKIQATFSNQPTASLLDGVNSSPTFPVTQSADPTPSAPAAPIATSSAPTTQETQQPTDDLPANTQFPPDSATARRLASIQEQHRERITRLKAQREAAEREEEKKRELARRQDTKAMTEASESQKSRSNRQYAEEQRKRKMEMEKERRRVLEQIKADREEMKIREMNRKAIAAEAELSESAASYEVKDSQKGKGRESGDCNLAFRLFDGSRISNKFPSDATVEKDVRPWLDKNRTDSAQPYKLVMQAVGASSKNIEGSSTLGDLGLSPSAILILKPIPSSRVASAFAPISRATTSTGQHNFFIAFLLSVWLMIKTFLGMHNPNASVRVGEKEKAESEDNISSEATGSTPVVSRDAAKKRIRTLHDGDGDKRSAYYNGNQLDFEPKKKGEDGAE